MGWLIALGILLLLAIFPLGVIATYSADGSCAAVIAGPVRICLFPRKKKEKKAGKKTEKKASKKNRSPDGGASQNEPAEKGGSWTDFLPLVKTGLDLLGDLRRKLRVRVLYIKLILAGGDPCDLAINYGRAWTAIGNLMPNLERVFVIKKRDIQVECDFTASETAVQARLELTITLGRLLALVTRYGIRSIREYLKISKKRKGGAKL